MVGSPRLRKAAAQRKQAPNLDKPAGFNIPSWRPAYTCDPEIISHREYPPQPPRLSTPRTAFMQRNASFIKEVEAQVHIDGRVGDAARVEATKAFFGASPRPPTGPPQMLVGKPNSLSQMPPAAQLGAASTGQLPGSRPLTARSGSGSVHSRYVAPADKALKRSQSFDFVRANKAGASLTPRRMQQPAQVRPWTMSKFNNVKGRLHEPIGARRRGDRDQ